MKLDDLVLADAHIHVDSYPMYNPFVCKQRGRVYGDVSNVWNLEGLEHHLTRDTVEEAHLIFSDLKSLDAIQGRVPHTKIRGWYWVRMPTALPDEVKAKFPQWHSVFEEYEERGIVRPKPKLDYRERGRIVELSYDPRVYGLKIHPVLDYFALTEENIQDVLYSARVLNLAVLFHTDDRKETAHLTHPDLYEPILKNNPDITFVIGHGGAFAHPRKVGENNPVARAYWSEERKPFPIAYGIQRALDIARKYPNAFYETSLSNNRIKAGLIGSALKEHPDLAHSIIVGTDYPLGIGAKVSGQLRALQEHGNVPDELLITIAGNRL